MTAATVSRVTERREGKAYNFVVATGETIREGWLCQLDSSGELVEAIVATGNIGGFIARKTVVVATAGQTLDVWSGQEVKLENGNSLDDTDVGSTAFAQDNQTVHNTASTRSAIGRVTQVDSDGAWVMLTPEVAAGLTAANNLSDVANAATSRLNLGVIHNIVLERAVDIIGANAQQIRYVHSGPDMTINHLRTVCGGTAATGTAILTPTIGATPITDGAVTISATAVEDEVDSSTPSAANVISEGEVLTVTVSGAQDAAIFASLMIEGSY